MLRCRGPSRSRSHGRPLQKPRTAPQDRPPYHSSTSLPTHAKSIDWPSPLPSWAHGAHHAPKKRFLLGQVSPGIAFASRIERGWDDGLTPRLDGVRKLPWSSLRGRGLKTQHHLETGPLVCPIFINCIPCGAKAYKGVDSMFPVGPPVRRSC